MEQTHHIATQNMPNNTNEYQTGWRSNSKETSFRTMPNVFYCQDQQKFQKHSEPRGGRGDLAPWILKFSAKKVIILVFSAKNKFNHFWTPLEKFWKNPLVPPTLEKIIPTPMFRTMTCMPNHYQKDQNGGNWHMKMPTWPTLTFKSEVQVK